MSQLGDFLKARRGEVQPEDVGIPHTPGRRRAQGLRREEVAALAAISTDYYTRIEQGRRTAPWHTLDAIARVLRIDKAGRDYLAELASIPLTRPRRQDQQATDHLLRLIGDLKTMPAMVLGRRMDVLAWNPMAAALMVTDFARVPEPERNYIRLVFTDPAVRALYPDWEEVGRLCVAQLHMEAARDPNDPRLAKLVGELSLRDTDFRRWWNDHLVAVRSSGVKKFRHPIVGDLMLGWDALTCAMDPDQQLVTWSAQPGTTSHDRLLLLVRPV
jgi:transcriptional regulator with XRE-family HTH domain